MKRRKELASATDADPDEEARSLTRRLLRALLSHATLRVENGCAAVVTTGDVIAAAAERGRLDGPRTTRALLGDIFDAVAEEAPSRSSRRRGATTFSGSCRWRRRRWRARRRRRRDRW